MSPAPADAAGIGRSSAVMAVGTVLSRITGFARNIVLAAALTTSLSGDAFNLANTIPNNVYILVAGGALNAVFIPQLVRAMRTEPDGGVVWAQRLLTITTAVLVVVSVVTVLVAPALVTLFSSGDFRNSPYGGLTVSYARWCLPQIAAYGVFVVFGQILNARGRFGPMMFAPIVNNLVAVAVFGTFLALRLDPRPDGITGWQIALVAGGSTLGVLAQAAVLVPSLMRAGVPPRPRLGWRGMGLGRVGRLATWTLLFVVLNQVAYVVVTRLTTAIATGARGATRAAGVGITVYQNAFLVFQLPHAIVAVSLVTALLPRMSRAAAAGDRRGVRRDIASGIRLLAVASLPAAAAMLVLGRPIMVTLYSLTSGGRVPVRSAEIMGTVLGGFAVAGVAFSIHYLLLRGFYAFEDTRTPFLVQGVVTVVNIALAWLGAWALAPAGPVAQLVSIAVAYGLAYVAGVVVSAALLRRRLRTLHLPLVVRTVARATVAATLAGLAAAAVTAAVRAAGGTGTAGASVQLVLGGGVLALGYVGLARAMRVTEVSTLLTTVGDRLRSPR